MTKKQERIESQNRASTILMLYTQLKRADKNPNFNKKYLDQINGYTVSQLEQDVKDNLSNLTYDAMTQIIESIPHILETEWVPIDFEALGI